MAGPLDESALEDVVVALDPALARVLPPPRTNGDVDPALEEKLNVEDPRDKSGNGGGGVEDKSPSPLRIPPEDDEEEKEC